MTVKNRKNSSNSVVEKSKKSMKKAQKDINNTSLATSKYGAILGILILIFGVIYLAIFGNYIYKRKTGQTKSALNVQNPNPFKFANIDMDAFKKAIKVDQNGKVTFSKEDLEKFKEVFVDVNGNAQVPPKDNGPEGENMEDVGNEAEAEANAAANDAAAGAEADEEPKVQRQKRSLAFESGNAPDETGEMSAYLSNLLTSGPSASFVDRLRNKIVVLNSPYDDVMEPANVVSTQHLRRSRRSINEHLFASGGRSNKNNVCHNINSFETDICY